ncbi:MAG TPA: hypothetical protein VI112_16855 [Bacteroidia bacterium]|jgi:hypothetical protein
MKKATVFFASIALLFTACTKQNMCGNGTGSNPSPRDIQVEYRITDASANVEIEYSFPKVGTQTLFTQKEVINKTYKSIAFTFKSNNFYSITARNVDPSTSNITVDIYIDGQLFKTGSLDHVTLTASASGKVE